MSVTKFMGCVCRQMTKSSILANKAEWSQEEEPEGFLGQSFGFNALYILMTSKSYVHPRLISSSDIHIHLLSDILVDLRGIQNVYPRLNIITTFPVNLIFSTWHHHLPISMIQNGLVSWVFIFVSHYYSKNPSSLYGMMKLCWNSRKALVEG